MAKEINYTDYKTDKEITREQYIANGLERGELVIRKGCGCVVIQDRTADAYIVYCHKHKSAPDLYEALKIITNRAMARVGFELKDEILLSHKALAKAGGKE